MDEDAPCLRNVPNDWMADPAALPARPQSLMEQRFKQYFAIDVHGCAGHDMYVCALPNGVVVVGLAPSHPLIQEHRHPGSTKKPAGNLCMRACKAQRLGRSMHTATGFSCPQSAV